MSSLQAKILNLISGIDDPGIRIEVARTVYFLFSVYASGRASEEEVLADLTEVCHTVISAKSPDLPPDRVKELAERMAREMLEAFRLEKMMRRMVARSTMY